MLSVGAIRFEDRFCASRKGGTGGGGWGHRSGWQCMAAVVAGYGKGLVSAGCPAPPLSCTNEHRKRSFHLVGTPFLFFFRQLSVWRSVAWSEGPDY